MEVFRIGSAHQLQGHVWAVEDASVVLVHALVADHVAVTGRIRINEHLEASGLTSIRSAGHVHLQVAGLCLHSGRVVQNPSHCQRGSHVGGSDQDVRLAATGFPCHSVRVAFDGEQQTLVAFSSPATIGVVLQRERAGSRGELCALTGNAVQGTNQFTVQFGDDFGRQDVHQFRIGVQTVDIAHILSQFQRVVGAQLAGHSSDRRLFDGHAHRSPWIGFPGGCSLAGAGRVGARERVRASVGAGARIVGQGFVQTLGFCAALRGFTSASAGTGGVAVATSIAGLQGEHQAGRAGHGLHACDVIGDQLGGHTTHQLDQHGVEVLHAGSHVRCFHQKLVLVFQQLGGRVQLVNFRIHRLQGFLGEHVFPLFGQNRHFCNLQSIWFLGI